MISGSAARQLAGTWSQQVILVSVSKLNFIFPKKSHRCRENANQKPLQTSSQEVAKRNVLAPRFSSHILKKFQFSCSLSRPQNLSLSGNLSRGSAHAYVTRLAKITRHRSGTQDARKSIVAWRRKGGGRRRRRGGQEGER